MESDGNGIISVEITDSPEQPYWELTVHPYRELPLRWVLNVDQLRIMGGECSRGSRVKSISVFCGPLRSSSFPTSSASLKLLEGTLPVNNGRQTGLLRAFCCPLGLACPQHYFADGPRYIAYFY